MRLARRMFLAFALTLLGAFLASSDFVYGIARESMISMTVQSGSLSVQLMPSFGGTFGESGSATASVTTDNFTGYVLSISSSGGTSLVNENDDEIVISTSNLYDFEGNIIQTTDANGNITKNVYDAIKNRVNSILCNRSYQQ